MPVEPGSSDDQLIRQAQAGQADAFGALYERYAGRVFRFAYAYLSDHAEAEDLTGEVFLNVWQTLGRYRWMGIPFQAYLLRAARNLLIDRYRRLSRRPAVTALENEPDGEDSLVQPGDPIHERWRSQALQQALGAVSEDYRMVLTLRFLLDSSPAETAAVMQRSEGAVRVLQHRALAALRLVLEKQDELDEL